MSREKRLAGRAIRKQRRIARERLEAFERIDLDALGRAIGEAVARMAEALADVFVTVGRQMLAFSQAYMAAVEHEHRMTYRALTTGPAEVA